MNCLNPYRVYYTDRFTGLSEVADVRCMKCIPCLLAYSNEWAFRCSLELLRYPDRCACCLTLTYDNDNLPVCSNLCRQDLTNFLKRLRKYHNIRYFGCGEYGSKFGRPHYHIIIYGYDFPDKKYFKTSGSDQRVYTSSELSRLWKKGFATIGEFSESTAFYCSRYLSKVKSALMDDNKVSPFTAMSLKPSIGFGILSLEDYERGYIYHKGIKKWIPRSFYQSLERRNGLVFPDLQNSRRELFDKSSEFIDPYWEQKNSYIKSHELLDKLFLL